MKSKFLILIFALSSTFMIAQEKLADKFFSNYGYAKATELYEEVLKKGDTSLHVLTRLGDCYYNNSKSVKAAFWYEKALKYDEKDINPEYIYKHIQSLRSLGDYEKADSWMKKFMEIQMVRQRILIVLCILLVSNLVIGYVWIPSSHFIYIMWAAIILCFISLFYHFKS